MTRYWEDIDVGDQFDCGEYTVTEEEIIEFTEQYDPIPLEFSGTLVGESESDTVVASSWHSTALSMRLLTSQTEEEALVGAQGFDEISWEEPLRAGDTMSVVAEVVRKSPDGPFPETGNVDIRVEVTNQDGERIVSYVSKGVMYYRSA